MNIFFLHYKPKRCAKYHVDRHVVKMILETAQLLCTAIILISGKTKEELNLPCKQTHINHPCAKWARKNKENWLWLQQLGIELCKEYTFRYEKKHKLEDAIINLQVPELPDEEFEFPPQAMPDEYKDEDTIQAYRNYYIHGKKHLHYWSKRHAWKNRKMPRFVREHYGIKI